MVSVSRAVCVGGETDSVFVGLSTFSLLRTFTVTAAEVGTDGTSFARGLVPTFPAGNSILVIGLVGTTILPTHFFLGSALAKDKTTRKMRRGQAFAAFMGMVISIIVVVAAVVLFRIGLFGAAFTDCITQALSAGIVARGCLKPLGEDFSVEDNAKWG